MDILDHWLENDFFCSVNWWYNEIQTPLYMARIGLCLLPWLTPKQKNKMDEIIGRGTLKGSAKATTYTGANLTDMMHSTVLHGIFTDDPALVLRAVQRVAEELRVANGDSEGMQSDGSYFQHGKFLSCAGSYGTVFVDGILAFVTQLYGTMFSLPEEKIRFFIDNLLDGQRYFHRGLGTTYFSIGRSVVYADGAARLLSAAQALSALDGIYRQKDLKVYAESFSDFSKLPRIQKFFPYSYVLISSAPEYFMGVRGAHESVVLTEVINRQNLLGYNMSYGSNTCYMFTGDEYKSIGAVLDFCMFPGITTYREDDASLLERYEREYNITWGKETYAGAHCDGKTDVKTGLAALYMELKNDGITGNQAFILYNGIMIVLGSGLRCSKTENTLEIRTSLDQCKLDSASVGDCDLVLNAGAAAVADGTRVRNGAFAYYNLGNGALTAVAETRQGSYSRTDSAKPEQLQRADVFSLYISHGTSLRAASYAYAVVADAEHRAPPQAGELPIRQIINSEKVQGVLFSDGHSVLVFHEGGSAILENGLTVCADKADIVIQ